MNIKGERIFLTASVECWNQDLGHIFRLEFKSIPRVEKEVVNHPLHLLEQSKQKYPLPRSCKTFIIGALIEKSFKWGK